MWSTFWPWSLNAGQHLAHTFINDGNSCSKLFSNKTFLILQKPSKPRLLNLLTFKNLCFDGQDSYNPSKTFKSKVRSFAQHYSNRRKHKFALLLLIRSHISRTGESIQTSILPPDLAIRGNGLSQTNLLAYLCIVTPIHSITGFLHPCL